MPQGSILGPLFFLIYINNLSNLSSNHKLLADDTSLFSVVHNSNTSTNNVNEDLEKINDWGNEWKMNVKPDLTKQAREVTFSHKIKKSVHTPLNFNNTKSNKLPFKNM